MTKPKIYFIHCRNFSNSGDMASCPYQYFKKEFDALAECRFVDISDKLPYNGDEITGNDIAIIGGGGLDGYHEVWQNRINEIIKNAGLSIGWGFGSNRNASRGVPVAQKINFAAFGLIGTRDRKERIGEYVPCVSCVGIEEENNRGLVANKAGVVLHIDSEIDSKDLPRSCDIITNAISVKRIIGFIQSHEFIISNSYHIAYWSLLLCKPFYRLYGVDCDSRYNLFEFEIPNWAGVRNKTEEIVDKNFLARCKAANLKFFELVKSKIEDFIK